MVSVDTDGCWACKRCAVIVKDRGTSVPEPRSAPLSSPIAPPSSTPAAPEVRERYSSPSADSRAVSFGRGTGRFGRSAAADRLGCRPRAAVDGGRHLAVTGKTKSAAGVVLTTLCAGQFLMTLDSSVMNVSIATVAKDVGTTVTGIQTAITFYTLVMASLMITGGKLGQIWGRKRAFAIGCVIYGSGSLLTALSQNLTVLLIGWSLLEGIGAALIMPAVVALVASNFGQTDRPRAYGLVASAGAIAVAAGPLIGGLFTTYASWRWVFVGEVLVVLIILALARRMADTPGDKSARMDIMGTVLSALGLAL